MSSSYVFEVETPENVKAVEAQVKSICGSQFDIDVMDVQPKKQIFLNYAFGDAEEKPVVTKVVQYLFGISPLRQVFYIRCYDAYDDGTPVSPEPIEIDKIFSKAYSPTMSVEQNFKYLISV